MGGGPPRVASHVGQVCAIEGCDSPRKARQWCVLHYARWKRHGDPLVIGRTPKGTAQKYFEEVALSYTGDECLIWPFSRNPNGYAYLNGKVVSRLVCEEEHGPPPSPGYQAAHSCGRGHLGCISRGHLNWRSPVANNADKLQHGTHNRGTRNLHHKITEDDVRQIRALKRDGASAEELGDRFGISKWSVFDIASGRTWSHVDGAAS